MKLDSVTTVSEIPASIYLGAPVPKSAFTVRHQGIIRVCVRIGFLSRVRETEETGTVAAEAVEGLLAAGDVAVMGSSWPSKNFLRRIRKLTFRWMEIQ